MKEPFSISSSKDREERVAAILEDVFRRRDSNEAVPDQEVVAAHPDLMPELGAQLRMLSRVARAQNLADGRDSRQNDGRRASSVSDPWRPLTSECFAGYELRDEIRRGGQGVVYRAVQKSTGRDVAIKVMHLGPFAGSSGRARFEREVRILARLKHSNIVTIHDSGVTAGNHFFVMDYIDGQPLDTHMALRSRSVAETLELFVKICEAINAAHLRGVIHRDLKPTNIIIDQRGEPNILDFGLAKMARDEITDSSQLQQMTLTGQFVGSVPWSSPEQSEGPAAQIDLRTDIYSLGVILYHMLTAQFPYPVTGTMREIFRNIAETNPPQPSSIRTDIDEDVDIIVLKCLAKEPARRYQNTAAVVQDVERYLKHQPILARSPSTVYQLKKLMVRHKLPSVLLATLIATASASAIWMGALYHRADAERYRATLAEKQAEIGRADARREAKSAQAVTNFLVNDMLASANPRVGRGRTITVEDVLSDAADRIDSLGDQPLIEASVREAMGRAYHSLGLYEPAEEHLRVAEEIRSRELGGGNSLTLRARMSLICVLEDRGNHAEMDILTRQTLDTARRVFGRNHRITLRAADLRARLLRCLERFAEAKALHEDTLERRRRVLGDDHGDTLSSLVAWSGILAAEGQMVAAEELCRQHLADCQRVMGDDDPATYGAMLNLGDVLLSQRQFEEAEVLLRGAHEGLTRILGDSHPNTLASTLKLALLFKEQDKLDRAEELLNAALRTSERLLGEEHPLTLAAMLRLGNTLAHHGEPTAAVRVYHELAARRGAMPNVDEAGLAHTRDCLAFALTELGRYAEAEAYHRQSLLYLRRTVGRGHVNTIWPMRGLVRALAGQGKLETARPIAEELLELRRETAEQPQASAYQLNCYARELLDVQPPDLRDPIHALSVALQAFELFSDSYHYNRYTLARAYAATGNLAMAIPTLQRALDHAPIEHSQERAEYEAALAAFFDEAGDLMAAEHVYRETLARRREALSEDHPDVATALESLGWMLLRHGKVEEAESILSQCLAIREGALDQHHWRTAHTKMLVGASLVGQRKLARAEALLLLGYEQMLEHEFVPRLQMRAVVERVIVFYENQEIPDAVSKWQARLTDLQSPQVGTNPNSIPSG